MLLLGLCALVMAPTCGKRRPPLPPLERVPHARERSPEFKEAIRSFLSGRRCRETPKTAACKVFAASMFIALAEKPTAPLPLTEDHSAPGSILIGSVPYDEIRKNGTNLTYTDTLERPGEPARLRYAIRYVNSAGQRAAYSNFFLMEPAAKVAEPPTVIKTGTEMSETAITLTWAPPAKNIDGSTPVNLLGYNVYRTNAAQPETNQSL